MEVDFPLLKSLHTYASPICLYLGSKWLATAHPRYPGLTCSHGKECEIPPHKLSVRGIFFSFLPSNATIVRVVMALQTCYKICLFAKSPVLVLSPGSWLIEQQSILHSPFRRTCPRLPALDRWTPHMRSCNSAATHWMRNAPENLVANSARPALEFTVELAPTKRCEVGS